MPRPSSDARLTYIASPYRAAKGRSVELHTRYARAAMEHAIKAGAIKRVPVAPHLLYTQCLDDRIKKDREIGMSVGQSLLAMCDEIWVFHDLGISEGMAIEIEMASSLGISIVMKRLGGKWDVTP